MNHRISVIIPVYNETSAINDTIVHLKRLDSDFRPEIIVVDGNPSGNTLKVISDEGIKKIKSSKGRGSQMNAGALRASGDILLFLHADTFLPPQAFSIINEAFRDSEISAGAFDLGIRSDKAAYRLIEAVVMVRCRLTQIPYGDQAIFIRKDVFENLGGYRDMPLMEDVDLMRRLKKAGAETARIPRKVSTSARRWEKEGVFFCTLRNSLLILLYYLGVPVVKLVKFYP